MTKHATDMTVMSVVCALAVAQQLGCEESTGAAQGSPTSNTAGTMSAGGTGTTDGGAAGSVSSSTAGTSGAGGAVTTAGSSSIGTGGSGAESGGTMGGGGGSAGTTSSGLVPTEANLKIAFAGDMDDGSGYQAVAQLIEDEGAHAFHTTGDMTYSDDPDAWWSATEAVLGPSFPVFLARGNHDDNSWSGFLPKAANHLGDAQRTAGAHDAAYKTVFKGLSMVAIRKGDTADDVHGLFAGDDHLWKMCVWHQNMAAMQIGGKGDEMGWGVYEACREEGAIIVTGHEHSYERTKTLVSTELQSVDGACSDGASLCIGPGRTFVTVTGLGGASIRDQQRCTPSADTPPFPSLDTSDASCPIWAAIYTSNQGANYGAQFFEFNVGGDPNKASGYFKTIDGDVIDTFDILHD